MENDNVLTVFARRLEKIGIKVEFIGNFPWIYLRSVNGNIVKDKFLAEHGFTAFWHPIKPGQKLRFSDSKEVFKIVRKYR